ncbi:hypothetical protein T09_14602 [Trichinella sp. T9]|nr:hypothetical protein T09_14602 [Trichinella sp. T9]
MSNKPRARIRMGDIPMNTIIAVDCPLILKEGNINENILVTKRNFGDVPKLHGCNVYKFKIRKLTWKGARWINHFTQFIKNKNSKALNIRKLTNDSDHQIRKKMTNRAHYNNKQ